MHACCPHAAPRDALTAAGAQGRARPSIAALYNWRYKALGDLPAVLDGEEYRRAVTGMRFDYQLVDVGNFEGRGETQPTPYFYQNLGEAEYVVATYQYLRLCGVPASSITILTTYNGQKHLLRDVINARCTPYPIFGAPHKVTTVDRYQGQQARSAVLRAPRSCACLAGVNSRCLPRVPERHCPAVAGAHASCGAPARRAPLGGGGTHALVRCWPHGC